jgi:hypothetical protein
METIIDFIGNFTHSAGPAVGRPFILREAAQMIVQAADTLRFLSGQSTGSLALQ